MNQDLTTLICLFHHGREAREARVEILQADIPEGSVALIARDEPGCTSSLSVLNGLDLPARDVHHLLNGLEHGDVVLTVQSTPLLAARAEAIFAAHQADLIAESCTA